LSTGLPVKDSMIGIGPIILAVAWELLTAWVRDDTTRVAPEAEPLAEAPAPRNVGTA
jgi:hypothetical protein